MPAFNSSPFGPAVQLLYAGVPAYLFGSWGQDHSPSQMYVTSVAVADDVATLGVTVYGGAIPAVGSLISVQGTQTSSGVFNVVGQELTAVEIAANGVGSVSFALTTANVASTPDAGVAIVPQPEVPEALSSSTGASVAVAMANSSFGGDLDRTVTAVCEFTALPTTATVSLQGSMFLDPAQFVTIGTIATVADGAVTANGVTVTEKWLFYRALPSGVTGSGEFTCKITGA
ncbi:MAG: hypothetical protein ACP5E5_11460 [Acidobacteriaceae bacterium]